MSTVLITGATGNVGRAVIKSFYSQEISETTVNRSSCNVIVAAVRDIEKAQTQFPVEDYPGLQYAKFDFDDPSTFASVFDVNYAIDIFFLLRPPHISDVKGVFRPLLQVAKSHGINKIVFLSVQGVEKSSMIPHHKIEKLIEQLEFAYIFVRPSYFMQNLTTTFLEELRSTHSLTLPAGNGKVNWIDVHDVGRACAVLLLSFDQHTNQAFEITGSETKSFPEALQILNAIVGTRMVYHSINPISFYFRRRTNLSHEFAMVITMLHSLPRIQPEPQISTDYQQLTRQSPTTLASFFAREKQLFL